MNSHTKKGITLVELIVAMTLTSIFAVLCVMLINPIERTYKSTLKLARAQLLADTLVDSIRKEVDDVKHEEVTDVWITNLSGEDDSKLLDQNDHASNLPSGNTLVFRRNNNYTEAIYAAVGISQANKVNVAANPLTPADTAHSIDTLFNAGTENLAKGIVHFGYYQAKEDDKGIYPIQPYDYTNPVMAKTYGDFTVTLNFSDLKLRDSKYPAYVMCKVTILENGKTIYSRLAVLCFAANGSGTGSGPSTPTPKPLKKNIHVTLKWVNDQPNKRPADGINVILRNDAGTAVASYKFTDVRSKNQQKNMFHNVETSGGINLAIDPVKVTGYEYTVERVNNGFVVTFEPKNDVTLISGPKFNKIFKDEGFTDVDGIIFTINDAAHRALVGSVTPINVSIDKDGAITDDYKLYLVNSGGTKTAYILSDTGTFNANKDMSSMFLDFTQVTSISNLNYIVGTSTTEDMHRMFKNCKKLNPSSLNFNGWNTSNVAAFDSMFYNVACDDSITSPVVVNMSNFDFSSARYYLKNGGDNQEVIGINKLVYAEPGLTSHVEKIIFPSGHKDMRKLNMMQQVFANADNLTEIVNFNDIEFRDLEEFRKPFENCPKIESIDLSGWDLSQVTKITDYKDVYSGLSGVKTLIINNLKIPNFTRVKDMFSGVGNVQTLYMNNFYAPKVTSVNELFYQKKLLQTVYLNGMTICGEPGATWTAERMFYQCFALGKVELNKFVNTKCTSLKGMFEDCKLLHDISGMNGWITTSVKDFSKMFYNCGCDYTDGFELDISGFGFNNTDGFEIDMSSMFYNSGTSKIVFPDTNGVKNATNIAGMFQNCKKLTGVENFILNTDSYTEAAAPEISFPNATTAYNLFTHCYELKNVKLNIKLPKCENVYYLFSNCSNLETLDLSKSDFSACTKTENFLNPSVNLHTLYMNEVDLRSCKTADNGFSNMFANCKVLTKLYMKKINLDGATDFTFMPWSTIKELYLNEASLAAMTVLEGRFRQKTNVELIDISDAKFGAYDLGDGYLSASQMFIGCTKLKTVIAKGFKGTVNLSEMFSGCTSLTSIDFERWDTSRATTMTNMFFNCSSMTEFNLSSFNTRNVTTMEGMFDGCSSAHGFNSSEWTDWSTSNVTSMKNMFHFFGYKTGVTERYTVNISNFDFSKVKSFFQMFSCDEKEPSAKDTISEIILPEGSACVVKAAAGSTETYRMFRNRWRLTSIQNVQYFNFECNNTDARSTFAGTSLKELDITAFDFDKITGSAQWLFNENYKLEKIYVNPGCNYASFADTNKKVEMFKLNAKLEGPNGTRYVTQNPDMNGERARIDEPGKPGYFWVH